LTFAVSQLPEPPPVALFMAPRVYGSLKVNKTRPMITSRQQHIYIYCPWGLHHRFVFPNIVSWSPDPRSASIPVDPRQVTRSFRSFELVEKQSIRPKSSFQLQGSAISFRLPPRSWWWWWGFGWLGWSGWLACCPVASTRLWFSFRADWQEFYGLLWRNLCYIFIVPV